MNSQLTGKDADAGKDRRQKKRATEDEMVGCITDSMDMNLGKLWEMVRDREAWCGADHGVTKSWTQLSKSTATMYITLTTLKKHSMEYFK